ncbi:hypothetical protein HDU86_005505 [Geranomyces michiganensis]|nr:hypothetical protein HDU86_005505 [Geranomyces michiganensis]
MAEVSSSFSDFQSRSSSHGDPTSAINTDNPVRNVYIRFPRGIPLPDVGDDPSDVEVYEAKRKRFARDVSSALGIRFPDGKALVFVDHYVDQRKFEGKDWGLAHLERLVGQVDSAASFNRNLSPDDVNKWGLYPDSEHLYVTDPQDPFYSVSLKVGTLRHTVQSISAYRNWLDRKTSPRDERRRVLRQNILECILPEFPAVPDEVSMAKYNHELYEFQLEAARMNGEAIPPFARPTVQPQAAPPTRLKTDRLILTQPQESDAEEISAGIQASLSELREFMPWAWTDTTEEYQRERAVRVRDNWAKGLDLPFVVRDRSTGDFIGCAGIHRIDYETRRTDIGYWIVTEHTGKGYASEAAARMFQFAVDDMRLTRVAIICNERNHKSASIARRLGFVFEGILRKYAKGVHGELFNLMVFAKVKGIDF